MDEQKVISKRRDDERLNPAGEAPELGVERRDGSSPASRRPPLFPVKEPPRWPRVFPSI